MTCSFAMRRSRKLLFDAGLNRNTRPRASQTNEGRTPSRRRRTIAREEGRRPPSRLDRRVLVDFLGAAGAARPGRRGLGAAVAVGPVVRKGQRRLYLELVLQ